MEIHILNVGCGNMAILLNPDGSRFVIDCNLTSDNKESVLGHVTRILGKGNNIDLFINTHRDADHMRGITDLNARHRIVKIWDTDVPGTTTDCSEYESYMALRRSIKSGIIKCRECCDKGTAKYRFMNGQWTDYSDANQQSAVIKVEYKSPACSVLFAGDTDFRPWKEKILLKYEGADLKSAILVAAHHGSITFFDDPSDKQHYYVDHINKIAPAITMISVGPNQHGLPDKKAMDLYQKYSTGSNQGNKVYTTQEKGNLKIELKDDGGLSLNTYN